MMINLLCLDNFWNRGNSEDNVRGSDAGNAKAKCKIR